tara:strand:- start:159 stop:365 length:207 start_codon:yes stop_codon:yes gene_type:complete
MFLISKETYDKYKKKFDFNTEPKYGLAGEIKNHTATYYWYDLRNIDSPYEYIEVRFDTVGNVNYFASR